MMVGRKCSLSDVDIDIGHIMLHRLLQTAICRAFGAELYATLLNP